MRNLVAGIFVAAAAAAAAGTLGAPAGAAPLGPRAPRKAATTQPLPIVDVDTYHNDNYRTGWNPHETLLTTTSVQSSSFGQLFSAPVDGLVYSQPLIAARESVASGVADLLVVGTQNDSLFAFNANTGAQVWKTNFTDASAGVTTVPISFDGCTNAGPQDGIMSTPVIDRKLDTIFVVVATLETTGSQQHIHFRLHAVSLSTGLDKQAPADITGSWNGPNGPEAFDTDVQFQRPALLETNGTIYIAFGAQCDFNANLYHGWVFGYSTSNLAQSSLINVTPATSGGDYFGGIWMSGYGLASDSLGRIYFAVGNGTFDGVSSFGESVLRLPSNLSLTGSSYFTPHTVFQDNERDADTGSGGVMVLPPQSSGKQMLVGQGKDGILFLLNQSNLGGYKAGGPDRALAELDLGGVWAGPAYWRGPSGQPYVLTTGGPLYEVAVTDSSLTTVSQTSIKFPSENGNGSTASVSSNANIAGSAVAWIVQRPQNQNSNPIELYAFDASNLSTLLFQTSLGMWPQQGSNPTLVPTIANGKVYVPSATSIVAFGLK